MNSWHYPSHDHFPYPIDATCSRPPARQPQKQLISSSSPFTAAAAGHASYAMKLPAGHVPGVGVHKATAYGGFGQQMLEKMGWSKGQGLGKEKDGMKEAIEVKKKEDSLGVS